MKGRVWSVEGENFEMFLEDGFSCFELEDDEGAQFASSSLSSLGLAISSHMHYPLHNNIPN